MGGLACVVGSLACLFNLPALIVQGRQLILAEFDACRNERTGSRQLIVERVENLSVDRLAQNRHTIPVAEQSYEND